MSNFVTSTLVCKNCYHSIEIADKPDNVLWCIPRCCNVNSQTPFCSLFSRDNLLVNLLSSNATINIYNDSLKTCQIGV